MRPFFVAHTPRKSWRMALGIALALLANHADAATAPALKDFMGINTSATTFNGAQFQPVVSNIRDYHDLSWDVGTNTPNASTHFPNTVNGYNWQAVYSPLTNLGYRIDVDLQFSSGTGITPASWGTSTQTAASAFKYGQEFGTYFGTGAGKGLVNSVQIGNEVSEYSDSEYATILANMAAGIKSVDPSMTVVTAAATAGADTGNYKSLSSIASSLSNVDAIAIHTYPYKNLYPNYQLSYPEDPSMTYLSDVQNVINWRNQNAPGKQVWVTEFGYDDSTQAWSGSVTDLQQAQYLTRSYLLFSGMGVDRAYMYLDDDNDSPTLHAASGLTRNGTPKPSFYAVQGLQSILGDYRFSSIVEQIAGNVYVYSYQNISNPSELIWAIWSPTGDGRSALTTLPNLPGTPLFADEMPTAAGPLPSVSFTNLGNNSISLDVGESPIFLSLSVPVPEPLAGSLLLTIATIATQKRSRRAPTNAKLRRPQPY
jgi:hypothetical protein